MAQANAQQRLSRVRSGVDKVKRNSRFVGCAWSQLDQKCLRAGRQSLPSRHGVIADNLHHRAQFHKVMDEVPGEAVVIVYDKNHATVLSLRSEEHTSELQSLMRISYAVFCLKKKHTNNKYNTNSPKIIHQLLL